MRITTTFAAVLLAGAVLAGCSTGTPGTAAEPSATTTTSDGPEPGPIRVEIDFADLSLKLAVPGRFGTGELSNRDYEECTQERYGWRSRGTADESEVLFVGTTDHACPEQQAVNGRFPTWDSTDDLPEGAEPVTTPVGEGHRFSLDYTECTNECTTFDYDVVFVQLPGDKSFWIQSSGVDTGTIDRIVASIATS